MRRVVFDLDGTLLDTLPDIAGVANRVLVEEGLPPLPETTVRTFIGNGVPVLVARMIEATALAPVDHGRLTARFLALYDDATGLTHPFPGATEALDRLAAAGLALSVCTNKPEAPARAVLAAMGWQDRFDLVIGGDTLAVKKPDPAPLRAALGDTRPEDALYVGDSETDAETAAAADIRFALFTRGYRKSPVAAIAHDHAFDHFDALPALALTAPSRAARIS